MHGSSAVRHLDVRWLVSVVLLLGTLAPQVRAAADDRLAAAARFLGSLSPDQREVASTTISAADRDVWSYLPGPRPGLRIADLKDGQDSMLQTFLRVALGVDGATRVERIRATEPVEDRGGGVLLGPDEFRIRFFGLSGDDDPPAWSWRLEGHHLSLHQTIVDDTIVSITPIFVGSVVRHDEAGEVLGAEDLLAHRILEGVAPDRRRLCLDPRSLPGDLRTAMHRPARWSFKGGIPISEAGPEARACANTIVERLLSTHPEDANAELARMWSETPDDRIVFAWCGREDRRGPHQWRLVSPGVVVEFSHSGGNVEHGHLVLRTPEGEFPARALDAWKNDP